MGVLSIRFEGVEMSVILDKTGPCDKTRALVLKGNREKNTLQACATIVSIGIATRVVTSEDIP